ncbi:MAG: GntR family transcriptional regulator [Rubrivivax sp.]
MAEKAIADNVSADKASRFSDALTADLLAGKYSPGEWLKQSDLEEAYRVNRFEVRIALAELSVRGLLEHLPNRGYRVCKHTPQDWEQLLELRSLLEVAACRLIVQRATEDQIAEFERLVKAFDRATEDGSPDLMREVNYKLHDVFHRMSGNPMLAEQIRDLRERGMPGRRGLWEAPKSVRNSNDDHFEMLEALKRRDADGLAAAVYRHLNRWRKSSRPATASDLD